MLAAPFVVFNEWILPRMYRGYVEHVEAMPKQPKPPPATGAAKLGTPVPPVLTEDELKDAVLTNLDGTPVQQSEWASANIGHPAYFALLYKLEAPAVFLAIAASVPLLWYFCLKRIDELLRLFRAETK